MTKIGNKSEFLYSSYMHTNDHSHTSYAEKAAAVGVACMHIYIYACVSHVVTIIYCFSTWDLRIVNLSGRQKKYDVNKTLRIPNLITYHIIKKKTKINSFKCARKFAYFYVNLSCPNYKLLLLLFLFIRYNDKNISEE